MKPCLGKHRPQLVCDRDGKVVYVMVCELCGNVKNFGAPPGHLPQPKGKESA